MKRLRDSKGQGLVELTIVLPLFLVLVLAVVQFGLFFGDYQGITDATRVAARTASLCAYGTTAPNTAGTNAASGLSGVTFDYSWAPAGSSTFTSTSNVGNTLPCKNGSGVPIAPGDQIRVTGTSKTDSISLVFYSLNLTPTSTTTVVVE